MCLSFNGTKDSPRSFWLLTYTLQRSIITVFYSGKVRPSEGSLRDVQFLLRTAVPWRTQSGRKRMGWLASAI